MASALRAGWGTDAIRIDEPGRTGELFVKNQRSDRAIMSNGCANELGAQIASELRDRWLMGDG
jgi:hypothetical protein